MQNALAYGLLLLAASDPATGLDLPVYQRPAQEQRLVNARDLHATLKVGKKYTDWIKERIGRHRFKHNTDYVMLEADKSFASQNGEAKKAGRGGHNRTEYALSLDAAKIVAMGTNNEVGDAIKRYFLYCEKLAFSTPDYTIAAVPVGGTLLPGIEEHVWPKFQREQASKLQKLLREKGGVNAVIKHGADTCRSQTGLGAREILQLGQAVGLPYRHRTNAREVLRHMAPAVACAMSLVDTAVLFGADRQQVSAVAAEHAQPLFAGLLAAGLGPAETWPGLRFVG